MIASNLLASVGGNYIGLSSADDNVIWRKKADLDLLAGPCNI